MPIRLPPEVSTPRRLEESSVVITGGTAGVGLAAALQFAAVGVPAEDHDATIYTLGMTAARLGPNQLSLRN